MEDKQEKQTEDGSSWLPTMPIFRNWFGDNTVTDLQKSPTDRSVDSFDEDDISDSDDDQEFRPLDTSNTASNGMLDVGHFEKENPQELVSQLRERIEKLEEDISLRREESKKQRWQMRILKQDREAMEIHQQDSIRYKALHEQAEKDLSSTKAALDEKTKEIEALKDYADPEKAKELQYQFGSLRNQFDELEDQHQVVLKSNQRLRSELLEAKSCAKSESAKVVELEREIAEQKNQLDVTKHQLETQRQINSDQRAVNSSSSPDQIPSSTVLIGLERQLAKAEKKYEDIFAENQIFMCAIESLTEGKVALERREADLENVIKEIEQENSSLKKNHKEHVLREDMRAVCDQTVSALTAQFKAEKNSLEESVAKVNKKLEEAEVEIEQLKQAQEESSLSLHEALEDLYEVKQQALAHQEDVVAQTNLVATHSRENMELYKELTKLKEDHAAITQKANDIQDKLALTQENCQATIDEERKQNYDMLSEQRAQIEQMKQEIRKMNAQLKLKKSLTSTLKILNREGFIQLKEKEIKVPLEVGEKHLKSFQVTLRAGTRPRFNNPVGGGCYGSVYAVNLNGTICIAKRLQDILMGRSGEEAVPPEGREALHTNFCRECCLMSKTKHPNIVKFLGVHFGHDRFDLTLFMEKLETDLALYVKSRSKQIAIKTKIRILHDVSCGLRYLHEECSIIHRDLTAPNVLLAADGRAKIADLGVSRLYNRSLSDLSRIPGTLNYMPPEALTEEPTYDKSLDIFSLGVLALYLAIQTSPDIAIHQNAPESVKKGEAEIYRRRKWIAMMEEKQPELTSLVTWCLADEPHNRPTTFCVNILLQEMKLNFV